jgi:four helix bundle protein
MRNNVAEGWESLHSAEKRQAYNIARRSCGEVRSMTYVLLDNRYITSTEHTELVEQTVAAGKLVTGLLRSLGPRN